MLTHASTTEDPYLRTEVEHREDKCEVNTTGNEVVAACVTPVGELLCLQIFYVLSRAT